LRWFFEARWAFAVGFMNSFPAHSPFALARIGVSQLSDQIELFDAFGLWQISMILWRIWMTVTLREHHI
jgi:hypothetical protein